MTLTSHPAPGQGWRAPSASSARAVQNPGYGFRTEGGSGPTVPTVMQSGNNNNNAAGGGHARVTLGAAPGVGNLLIATVVSWLPAALNSTDWTVLDDNQVDIQAGVQTLARYVQIGDTAVLPDLTTGNPNYWVAMVHEVSGGLTGTLATDVIAHNTSTDATGATSFASTALYTTLDGQLGLIHFGAFNGDLDSTVSAGWTDDGHGHGIDYGAWVMASEFFATGGSSDQATMTVSYGGGTHRLTMASILIGPGTGTPPPPSNSNVVVIIMQ